MTKKLFFQVQPNTIRFCFVAFIALFIAFPAFSAEKAGALIELKRAFSNGNIAAASKILGGNIDVRVEIGWPLIVVAANHRHLSLVQEIIDTGADLNEKNKHGDTALIISAYQNYPDVVRLLASHGAKLNERGNDGATALIWAVKKGYLEVSEILLAQGADANLGIEPGFRDESGAVYGQPFPGRKGYTALILATENGDLAMVNALLKAGADANVTDMDCRSALEAAKPGGRDDIAAILLEHGATASPRCIYAERQRHVQFIVLGIFICLLIWEKYRRKPAAGARILGYFVNLLVGLFIFESDGYIKPLYILVPVANICVLLFLRYKRLVAATIVMNMVAMADGILAVFADYHASNPMLLFYIIEALLVAGIQYVNIRVLRAQLNVGEIGAVPVAASNTPTDASNSGERNPALPPGS